MLELRPISFADARDGASLRAAGWICDGPAGKAQGWTGKRYEQTEILDEMKVRWRKEAPT